MNVSVSLQLVDYKWVWRDWNLNVRPGLKEMTARDVTDEVEEFVLSLPSLVREVQRNMHNPNIAVLEVLSRRLADSLDLFQIIDSRLSASSVDSGIYVDFGTK